MFESLAENIRDKSGGKLPFEDTGIKFRAFFTRISENKRMGSDILFMVTYMASIITADVSRPEIFAFTATRKEYITSKYIGKVETFVKRWNYNYAKALTMVAERISNPMLSSMFTRYGNSISSGVPDDEFLLLELSTVRSVYRSHFEQGIEMVKKWGDAYIALMLSATIVSIIIMVSIAIYAPDDLSSTLNTSYLLTIGISIFGIGTMYHAIPGDQKCHELPGQGSYEQRMIQKMERFIVPTVIITTILLFIGGFNAGLIFLVIGILLVPLGIFGFIDDTNIIERDNDFSVFIRSLGTIMGGKGLTVGYALAEIDTKTLVNLSEPIKAAYSKLNLGLDENLVWNRFVDECGSNLISKYLNIFRDSIKLGGSPSEIARIVSSSMLEQTLLREKREMLSTGFIVLLIPMHVAMIGIFMFLFRILISMSHAVTDVMASFDAASAAMSDSVTSVGGTMTGMVNIFVNFPEDQMGTYIAIVLLIITLSNIIAGKIVKGGANYLYYAFGSIMFTLTGLVFIVTPFIVDMLFQIPTFGGVP
ncbi:archaellar assembly protein FlaJ [Methanogenium marinum]|uniref:Archaellar assembly protein FlaJ n=1 Tax=Methanogenium marinum TaxID=348610 RepID=A0A9Q4KR06_9EURY|nr:archaellar assembly protein FlaJ [Methanogenium marinum]MDE4907082.1 archaellar assembly protein FlaJ [Methanogenium marinum]